MVIVAGYVDVAANRIWRVGCELFMAAVVVTGLSTGVGLLGLYSALALALSLTTCQAMSISLYVKLQARANFRLQSVTLR